MDIVVVGHVDHGKSTIVGRLLADTNSLPTGKLEAVKSACARNSKPFEYAFLLDAFRDEQSQGITIDSARVFFKTQNRNYAIIDAPGHVEFLKNMVSGASRAEASLIVIDAKEGIQENSRRHGYLLSILGIRQVAVLVNKMDLVGYNQKEFEKIRDEFSSYLAALGITPSFTIPVAAMQGTNLTGRSEKLSWYRGPTVVEALDAFVTREVSVDQPFRMPVQDVYKFTRNGDDRRIIAGTVESGSIAVGDEIVFQPSGKKSRVKTIEAFNAAPSIHVSAKSAVGLTLTEQIFVSRGEIAARPHEARVRVAQKIRVSIFWLGQTPMAIGRAYVLKLGTAKAAVRLTEITKLMNSSSLETVSAAKAIPTNFAADCWLELDRPLALDLAETCTETGRFVLLDGYDISGGGLLREVAEIHHWANITRAQRERRFQQKALLILFVQLPEATVDLERISRELEARLFAEGRTIYALKDASCESASRLLDAGFIVIMTASLMEHAVQIRSQFEAERVVVIGVGHPTTENSPATDFVTYFVEDEDAAVSIDEYLISQFTI